MSEIAEDIGRIDKDVFKELVEEKVIDSRNASSGNLRWDEYQAHPPAPGGRVLLLSPRRGGFTLEPIGSVTPRVDFEVLEDTGGRQRIAVTWSDDDYQRHSRYVTDGVRVAPEYFRIWGAGMVFVGIVPGVLAAWLLGRGLRRLWRRRRTQRADG